MPHTHQKDTRRLARHAPKMLSQLKNMAAAHAAMLKQLKHPDNDNPELYSMLDETNRIIRLAEKDR
jgi:hypothetical protein